MEWKERWAVERRPPHCTHVKSNALHQPNRFPPLQREQNIVPGIKVDTGLQMMFGTDGETATQGLDGLGDRCKKYYKHGARFGACTTRVLDSLGGGGHG